MLVMVHARKKDHASLKFFTAKMQIPDKMLQETPQNYMVNLKNIVKIKKVYVIGAKLYLIYTTLRPAKRTGICMGIVDKVLGNEKKDPQSLYFTGESLCRQGHYTGAIEYLEKVIAADPKNASAWQLAGFALYQQGAFEQALQYFDQALSLDPRQPDALVYKGLIYAGFGRYSPALLLFDQALAIHPSFIQAWYARGLTFGVLGEYDRAIAAYEKVLRIDPGHTDALIGIDVARKKKANSVPHPSDQGISSGKGTTAGAGLLPPAVPVQTPANRQQDPKAGPGPVVAPVRPQPQNAESVPVMAVSPVVPPASVPVAAEPAPRKVPVPGAVSSKLPVPKEAPAPVPQEPPLKKDLVVIPPALQPGKISPTEPVPAPQSSTYQEKIGVLEAEPDAHEIGDRLRVLGSLYTKTGRFRDAAECFEQYVEENPDNAGAWQDLGDARKKAGRYEEALTAYDRSLHLDCSIAPAWMNRAKTLVMLGDNESALTSCDRAIALDPDYVEAWLYKGFIFKKIRRDVDAVAAYSQVLALNPGSDQARREIRRIKGGA